MNDEERKQQFLAQVRKALDEQLDNLDPTVESGLTRMRREALEAAEKKGYIGKPTYRWSTLGAAAAAAAVLLVALFTGTPTDTPVNGSLEDLEILTLADQYELVENMEFYSWLADLGPDAG
jgi:hypothetical protein